jgi:hypothetical protein
MAHISDTKEIPGRVALRSKTIGTGLVCALLAVAFASIGAGEAFLFMSIPAGLLLLIGSKIKTHKKLTAYGGSYQ